MFRPNNSCLLYAAQRDSSDTMVYDARGEASYPTVGVEVACSVIDLDLALSAGSVRVDQSPSRGRPEHIEGDAMILFPTSLVILEKDIILAEGRWFEVSSVHPRRTVWGKAHHIEVILRKSEAPSGAG